MGLRGRSKLVDERLFFVTTTCHKKLPLFLNNSYYQELADSLLFLNKKYDASIVAYVFMPNHIHLILYFHIENNLSNYMRDFKKYTASVIRRKIEIDGEINLFESIKYEIKEQKFKIWMDRFDDLYINQRDTLETKIEYIHNNPVKKNMVKRPEEYYWSSAGFYHNSMNLPIPILNYIEII